MDKKLEFTKRQAISRFVDDPTAILTVKGAYALVEPFGMLTSEVPITNYELADGIMDNPGPGVDLAELTIRIVEIIGGLPVVDSPHDNQADHVRHIVKSNCIIMTMIVSMQEDKEEQDRLNE